VSDTNPRTQKKLEALKLLSTSTKQHPTTLPARNQQCDDFHRPDRDAQHSPSEPFDNACALMTRHHWLRHAVRLVALGDIGVANSSRGDPYQDFAVQQLFKIEFFDRGGLM
jgi:hypothetical protein